MLTSWLGQASFPKRLRYSSAGVTSAKCSNRASMSVKCHGAEVKESRLLITLAFTLCSPLAWPDRRTLSETLGKSSKAIELENTKSG